MPRKLSWYTQISLKTSDFFFSPTGSTYFSSQRLHFEINNCYKQLNVYSAPLKFLLKRGNLLKFEQKVWRTWAYFREKCCINAKMVVFRLNPIALQPLLCGVLTTFCQQLDRMGQKGWYCGCKNPALLLPCTGKKCFRKNHEMFFVQSVYSVQQCTRSVKLPLLQDSH